MRLMFFAKFPKFPFLQLLLSAFSRQIGQGVRQGCRLSPIGLLFNISCHRRRASMHNGCSPTDVREIRHANKCEKDQSYANAREEVENNGQW